VPEIEEDGVFLWAKHQIQTDEEFAVNLQRQLDEEGEEANDDGEELARVEGGGLRTTVSRVSGRAGIDSNGEEKHEGTIVPANAPSKSRKSSSEKVARVPPRSPTNDRRQSQRPHDTKKAEAKGDEVGQSKVPAPAGAYVPDSGANRNNSMESSDDASGNKERQNQRRSLKPPNTRGGGAEGDDVNEEQEQRGSTSGYSNNSSESDGDGSRKKHCIKGGRREQKHKSGEIARSSHDIKTELNSTGNSTGSGQQTARPQAPVWHSAPPKNDYETTGSTAGKTSD
jgi:hypothetical protein